ncbi:MAG: sugar transferase, partial [Lachnospiraceae bacterium]|nr:sugar transferase [Lachnospiraceae bacterium]
FDIEYAGKKTLNRVGKYAVVTFARNIFSNRQLFLKRTLDILGSLVGMVILAIATAFVAPLIKLDSPGPVFFGQTRVGKNGRKFTFYKFRSMYVDAEDRKKELMDKNEVKGLMFKMEDDPRITRVGKFLRRTSIDELPQFWNILKGDMSLVGTRPPTVDEFEQYGIEHKGRLSMTPGLTGLWQISGRSDIKDFDEVVKLDMEYIDNWTIWKDIKILMLTFKVVFTGKGSK